MARVEIGEVVLDGKGKSVPGAVVAVKKRDGSDAVVYPGESGAALPTNIVNTDGNGRIEAWVDEDSYDLLVTVTPGLSYTQRFEAVSGAKFIGDNLKVVGTIGIGTDPGGTALAIVNSADRQMILLRKHTVQTGDFLRAEAANGDYRGRLSAIGEWYSCPDPITELAYIAHGQGDIEIRWGVKGNGEVLWGDGTAGPDVNLYRGGANILKTDDEIRSTKSIKIQGALHMDGVFDTPAISMGTLGAEDVTLYRSAADTLMLAEGDSLAFGTTTGSKIGTSGTQKIGFYGATPIIRPTGVAVTAGGIHAALVSLGLITA